MRSDMTAEQLQSILAPVPAEALPKGFRFTDEAGDVLIVGCDVNFAVDACVGSMLQWLIRQEWKDLGRGSVIVDELEDGDVAVDHNYLSLDNKANEYRVCDLHGPTLLESLAAACVAVSK